MKDVHMRNPFVQEFRNRKSMNFSATLAKCSN